MSNQIIDFGNFLYNILIVMHLKNLERILKYTLKETSGEKIIDTLYEKTKSTIEQHITKRDVENFVA